MVVSLFPTQDATSGSSGTFTKTGSGTSQTFTLTTGGAGVTFVGIEVDTSVAGPTTAVSGGGMTWTKEASVPVSPAGQYAYTLDVWAGVAASAVSAQTITITINNTIDNLCGGWFTYQNVNTTTLLAVSNVTGTTASGGGAPNSTITPNTGNVLVLAFAGGDFNSTVNSALTVETGFTSLFFIAESAGHAWGGCNASEQYFLNYQGSAITAGYTTSGDYISYIIMAINGGAIPDGYLVAWPGQPTLSTPADFGGPWTIYTFGDGGGGGYGSTSDPAGGGGGGGYSSLYWTDIGAPTLAVSTSYTIGVGLGGTGGTSGAAATSGTGTWFNGASLAASSVGANGGAFGETDAQGSAGGAGGSTTGAKGTTKNAGGSGGAGAGTNFIGGGGGGAGGAGGNGGIGGSAGNFQTDGCGGGGAGNTGGSGGSGGSGGGSGQTTAGAGGTAGDGTAGGAGGTASLAAGAGSHGSGGGGAGTQGVTGAGGPGYDSTLFSSLGLGPGGGGGSSSSISPHLGGPGGLFGGGGGGGSAGANGAAGAGGGIIVVYTPNGPLTSFNTASLLLFAA